MADLIERIKRTGRKGFAVATLGLAVAGCVTVPYENLGPKYANEQKLREYGYRQYTLNCNSCGFVLASEWYEIKQGRIERLVEPPTQWGILLGGGAGSQRIVIVGRFGNESNAAAIRRDLTGQAGGVYQSGNNVFCSSQCSNDFNARGGR